MIFADLKEFSITGLLLITIRTLPRKLPFLYLPFYSQVASNSPLSLPVQDLHHSCKTSDFHESLHSSTSQYSDISTIPTTLLEVFQPTGLTGLRPDAVTEDVIIGSLRRREDLFHVRQV